MAPAQNFWSSQPGVDVVEEAADRDRVGDQRVRAHLADVLARARRPGPRRRGTAARRRPGRRTRRPARAARPRCSRPSRSGCAGRPGSARRRAGARRAPAPRAPAAVTRPPGLRKIFASPGCEAEHPQRVDPRVHAGHDRDAGVRDAVEAAEVEVVGERLGWRRAGRRRSVVTVQQASGTSAGRAEQVAGRETAGGGAAEQHQREHAGDDRADRGAEEDRRAPGRCRPP